MVLMIYQSEVFREFLLPNTDNTDHKILIDRNQFDIKKSFYLSLEVLDRSWFLSSSSAYRVYHHNAFVSRLNIKGGEIITIKTLNDETLMGIVIDANATLSVYEKYNLFRVDSISIGKDDSNLIQYEFMNLISKTHCVISGDKRTFYLKDYSSNGVFVNNRRVRDMQRLRFGDTIEIFGLKVLFFNEIIAVGSSTGKFRISPQLDRFILPKLKSKSSIVRNNPAAAMFNRSPRIFPSICRDSVAIEPPTTQQLSKKKPLLYTIGPSFTMAIPMLLGCGIAVFSTMMGGGGTSAFMFTGIIMAFGSAVFGALWAYLNIKEAKRSELIEETQRFNLYSNYLIELSEYIKSKYRQNAEALFNMYPSPEECCCYNENSPELWNRNYTHDDFLFCRLGVGDIDFQVDIQIPKEKFSVTYDSLKDKPVMLYENFKTLKNVPVGVNFAESSLYGIAGGKNKNGVYLVVNNIIAQLVTSISYTDIKIAFCYNKKALSNQKVWDYIKWLPHVWSENKKIRYFATNQQEIADVFFELANIMRQRDEVSDQNSRKNTHRPHYFLFVSDISLLDGEIISKYIFDTKKDYGLTTFIMTDNYQNLPNVCENIIQNDSDFCGCYNVLDRNSQVCQIKFDTVAPERLEYMSKNLANILVREIEDDTSLVSSLDFFEMYKINSLEELRIEELWRKNRTYNSMRALIGQKAGGSDCYLDIHEKYHGPHGLIAGTTGSGKSELIQTLVLSLAINYSPDDISFFVIDFKGGGMANLFSDLPHLVGQISNLSGNQISRAMISIKSENLRRQKIFSEYGVNNINHYTRLFKSGEASQAIPHLVIIIDEFAELKKEEPEFMRELISVAQVGRSLGVHLILATQKPSGTVDDNIWSNAKFRLCLRVQDRQDSNDMLHKTDAAYITQAGRCYLQVGNDEVYELFQSGWSGAVYDENSDGGKTEIATMITPTGKTAIIGSHTKMKRKEQEKRQWIGFLIHEIQKLLSDKAFIYGLRKQEGSDEAVFACKIIEKAQKHGYNIGSSNSEVRAVQNLVELISKKDVFDDNAVDYVLDSASANKIKLPEIKEKTQLEAIVEYIKKIADKNGYKTKSQLWMPLLKTEIALDEICDCSLLFSGNGWKNAEKWTLEAVVGMYDDPQNQAQLPLTVNFSDGGHLTVCGAVVSGKSTFLQTLIFSLAVKYSPAYVNFYIIDFSSGMLSVFETMPHTGGVLKENDLDKIGKFFNMIQSIISERKNLFKGGNYSQYVKVNGIKLPSIIIVIDNFASFKEKTDNIYEDVLIHIAREGVGYGIFLVITSAGFGISEIQNRIGDNIRTVISLEMSDKFKYLDVLRTTHVSVTPESGVKGRGIAFVEGRLLEFQTALAVSAEDDYKRSAKIENICAVMKKTWNGPSARPVPFIPENPSFDEFRTLDEYRECISETPLLPFAYNTDDASVYSADLRNIYCYSISGKRRTGKTNLLKMIMYAAAQKGGRTAVIEKDAAELKQISSECGFEYLSTDKEMFEFFKGITNDFIQRNKLKHKCNEDGMTDTEIYEKMSSNQPIFVFIADISSFVESVYRPSSDIGNMSAFFENIIEKGFLHNIYFFGCINTDDIASVGGYKVYQYFTSYKTGVHLGGNVSSQRIFNFQNIHYSQMSKSSKKGEGLTPSKDDETIAQKLIIPLVEGKSK